MKKAEIILIISLAAFVVSYGAPERGRKTKRDLLDLADMFDILTGLDPTDYIPYGNWCGYGGSGEVLDRIDGCCEVHDKCYDEVSQAECSDQQIHLINYQWKKENDTIVCDENTSNCKQKTCQCDRDVVACVHRFKEDYSDENRFARFKETKK